MLKLNLKIALRNLFKNRVYALINIAGLAIGLAACLLLMLYASYEWNYDRQFKNHKQIYQAMVNLYDANGNISRTIGQTQNVLAQTLTDDFAEVAEATRITDLYDRLVTHGQNRLKLANRYADQHFLNLFNHQFISGNPNNALSGPNSIVLTQSAAMRLFGKTDVLNQNIRFENQVALKVTGVIKDLPANTTYNFEVLTPWLLFEQLNGWPSKANWGSHDFYTLFKLHENTDVGQLNSKLKGLVKKHFPSAKEDVFLYPLTALHLEGSFANGKPAGGKIQQVRMFVGLALGILLLACINFMNLATANAQKRAKEIGIKKTIGASRPSLVVQFMLESLILTLVSILISIMLLEFCLPWFNNLLDINIVIDYLNPINWLLIGAVLLFTALVAGSYPAFYLSGFNVVQALKKSLSFKKDHSLSLRQVLVVVQFGFAIVLIAATLTIYKQIQFIKNRPLGYTSNGLVEMPHEGLLYPKFDLLKTKLLASGAVVGVAQSSSSVTSKESTIRGLEWKGMAENDKQIDFDQIYTTYDFVKTVGIKLLAGRDFSKQYASDQSALLLSKKAVQVMNLSHPIGANVLYQGKKCTVVGVFDDILWGSPSQH